MAGVRALCKHGLMVVRIGGDRCDLLLRRTCSLASNFEKCSTPYKAA